MYFFFENIFKKNYKYSQLTERKWPVKCFFVRDPHVWLVGKRIRQQELKEAGQQAGHVLLSQLYQLKANKLDFLSGYLNHLLNWTLNINLVDCFFFLSNISFILDDKHSFAYIYTLGSSCTFIDSKVGRLVLELLLLLLFF